MRWEDHSKSGQEQKNEMTAYFNLSFFSLPLESKTMRPSAKKNKVEKLQRQEKEETCLEIKWE